MHASVDSNDKIKRQKKLPMRCFLLVYIISLHKADSCEKAYI